MKLKPQRCPATDGSFCDLCQTQPPRWVDFLNPSRRPTEREEREMLQETQRAHDAKRQAEFDRMALVPKTIPP